MSVKQYDSTNKILKLIAGGTLWADCPIGTINAYGGATAPEGWLLCQGQALSRTTYKDLFDVIGTNFGSGDGSTTFNLPDMREATTKGAGLTGKTVGAHVSTNGLAVGEFLDDRLQDHTQSVSTSGGNHQHKNQNNGQFVGANTGGVSATIVYSGSGYEKVDATAYSGNLSMSGSATTISSGRHGATTEVKSVGVNFIMKAKQAAMPSDLRAALEAALDEKDMLVWG